MAAASTACAGCRQRDRRIAELEAELDKLRQQLAQDERAQNRQAQPFRREQSAEHPKKPGRRKGHKADLRPVPTPDQIDRIVDVPLDECPMCQAPLFDQSVVVQYQTDLPPIVPIITQFNIATGYCSCCRQYWQGRHPEQTSDAIGATGNTLGPVVLTMAAEMKHRFGVSYRKICDFLQTYAQLRVCPATFIRAEQRLADLARPTYDLILEALRQSHVVHADETGWRVGRRNAWLWVFSSKVATVYVIRTGKGARGQHVPQDILGPGFDGYLVVDGLKTYDVLEVLKGRCNGHLLRRCHKLRDTVPTKEQKHIQALSDLLKEAIALANRRDELKAENFANSVQDIEDRLDAWLEANLHQQPCSADLDRLDTHVRAHRGEWLTFLHDPEVPPTNNHAEQMLRPAVITRKVGGCNKSLLGALVHGILSSVMVTCHRRGKRFLDLARQLWQSSEPQAIAVETLPDAIKAEPVPQNTG
ncbi:MAG: IS66 family transposase [Pseudonocardiaceae bacterium]